MNAKFFEEQRREMIAAIRAMAGHVAAQIDKSALDERVLTAMVKVLRHEFVPIEVQQYAYLNRPIPIGFDKTISQPLMVAVMTDLLELKPDDVVLEIGTGLGYQAAVLAELAGKVYSLEIIDELGNVLSSWSITNETSPPQILACGSGCRCASGPAARRIGARLSDAAGALGRGLCGRWPARHRGEADSSSAVGAVRPAIHY